MTYAYFRPTYFLIGTPQEMTDHTGSIIWKAEYKGMG
ncbi:RHS domain-containing protein [Acinetobacter bereziniae]|nr:RHS domain-containing protein [Acinetobacter bereziniae]NUG09787.1 RHS domain-containing protein [Acinetobacter bereziniae]NUG71943.1 RHS domain-containing protein [Acinetobacter bereziniae]NUG82403.1 RHS domain-containing protein [Acinetobacter bereziniae]